MIRREWLARLDGPFGSGRDGQRHLVPAMKRTQETMVPPSVGDWGWYKYFGIRVVHGRGWTRCVGGRHAQNTLSAMQSGTSGGAARW